MITLLADIFEKIDYTPENGLVDCEKLDYEHIAEWLHITERAKKLGAKAVLFRRYFDDENSLINSKPSVYIFDDENLFTDNKKATELHAKIWSAGEVDAYMIVDKTELTIINARRPAEVKNNDLNLENLKLYSSILEEFNDQRFSAHIFGKGMFWEQGSWELDENQTPFQILLDQLEKTRAKLKEKNLNSEQKMSLDRLLLLSILVMFLGEKKDSKGDFALSKKYEIFGKNHQTDSFIKILQKDNKGELCIKFLNELANDYNGKIFDILTTEEGNFIKIQNLAEIAQFVEGMVDAQSNQISIWRKYNFDFIPIELISSIYENFLQSETKNKEKEKEKGVVYTPPFLVNFLIDEVMPLNLPKENYLIENLEGKKSISYKILDPACGSGIFLVAAYKRLLDWWLINNFEKIETVSKEKISDAFKEILEGNIFGVDINKTATQITIFSLTIAFLDKIDPKLLWEDFKFKDLSAKNIKTQNFFEWASTAPKDFDLVVGNPPFNVATEYKKRVKEHHKKFITPFKQKMGFECIAPIPDNFTFYFLEFARQLSTQKKVCLIIPSTLLLYSPQKPSINYRKALFENANVEKIYDFTHLRRILFKRNNASSNTNSKKKTDKDSDDKNGAEIPVCAIILNNSEPQFNKIEHTVIKRIISTEKKLRFEIDHYDRHFVRFDWACTYPFVWKCNLLGGGRLFHLIYRLSLLQNLEQFIKEKKKENSEWIFQVGYKDPVKNTDNVIDYIYDRDKVMQIIDGKIVIGGKENIKYFKSPRPYFLYKTPFLLFSLKVEKDYLSFAIKEIDKNEYLVFTNRFAGIHAPKEDFESLQEIYNRLHKHQKTYLLWVLMQSSIALISQETAINKTELETLPFPNFTDEEEEYLELTETEEILRDDVLNHYKHLGKSVKIGDDGYEPLEMKLNVNDSEDEKILYGFGDAFCKNLNEIYAKNGNSWQKGKIYQTKSEDKVSEGFIIYQFGFGTTTSEIETIKVDETYLKKLIFDEESNRGAIWVRVGRIYQHTENGYDCVFLIKPANIRYWLRSVALRDAGDVFMDLKKAGL